MFFFYFYTAGVVLLISLGLLNLMIAILGRNPKFLATTVGTLTKANTRRNVPGRHCTIPVLTDYTYVYTVNGRQYKHSREGFHSKRRLLPKAVMVYVKWFPRHAYPHRFRGTTELLLGIGFLFLGLLFLLVLICGT